MKKLKIYSMSTFVVASLLLTVTFTLFHCDLLLCTNGEGLEGAELYGRKEFRSVKMREKGRLASSYVYVNQRQSEANFYLAADVNDETSTYARAAMRRPGENGDFVSQSLTSAILMVNSAAFAKLSDEGMLGKDMYYGREAMMADNLRAEKFYFKNQVEHPAFFATANNTRILNEQKANACSEKNNCPASTTIKEKGSAYTYKDSGVYKKLSIQKKIESEPASLDVPYSCALDGNFVEKNQNIDNPVYKLYTSSASAANFAIWKGYDYWRSNPRQNSEAGNRGAATLSILPSCSNQDYSEIPEDTASASLSEDQSEPASDETGDNNNEEENPLIPDYNEKPSEPSKPAGVGDGEDDKDDGDEVSNGETPDEELPAEETPGETSDEEVPDGETPDGDTPDNEVPDGEPDNEAGDEEAPETGDAIPEETNEEETPVGGDDSRPLPWEDETILPGPPTNSEDQPVIPADDPEAGITGEMSGEMWDSDELNSVDLDELEDSLLIELPDEI